MNATYPDCRSISVHALGNESMDTIQPGLAWPTLLHATQVAFIYIVHYKYTSDHTQRQDINTP